MVYKDIITNRSDDLYLSLIDTCHMEDATLNYLAGLIDGQKLSSFVPTAQSTTEDSAKSILKYYYDIHQPCAVPYKSQKTLDFWKELYEEVSTFTSILSKEQTIQLEELSNKHLEGVGYSMADAFVHGFKPAPNYFT